MTRVVRTPLYIRMGELKGHAAPPSFPYPKWVWSPTGGWWPHPSAWRRNTAIVSLGLILINIPIYFYSEANEKVLYSSKERDDEYYRKISSESIV